MSGELTLKNSGRWKKTLPAVVLTALVTFLFVMFFVRRLEMGTMMAGIMAAVITYILFRTLYPTLSTLFNGGQKTCTLAWEITGNQLQLGEETIPMDAIKMVHCWPNRDALGNRLQGWTINIETTGKNHMLCSLEEGEVEASVEGLHQLVEALGYKERWVEE